MPRSLTLCQCAFDDDAGRIRPAGYPLTTTYDMADREIAVTDPSRAKGVENLKSLFG